MLGHSEGGLPRRSRIVAAERLARFLQGDIGGHQSAPHVRHAKLLIAGACGRARRRGSNCLAGFVDGGCHILDGLEDLGPLGFRSRRLRSRRGFLASRRRAASQAQRARENRRQCGDGESRHGLKYK
jgi:hypothetical protein